MDVDQAPHNDNFHQEFSAAAITETNFRLLIEKIFVGFRRKKFINGARQLNFDEPCRIEITNNHRRAAFVLPISGVDCSRIICEFASPFNLVNQVDFLGAQILPSAWQIPGTSVDFGAKFNRIVREETLEQMNLNDPSVSRHFEVVLKKVVLFGRCAHSKSYALDESMFVYLATVIIFLPSTFDGGVYRFEDEVADENDFTNLKFLFDHSQNDRTKPFIFITPADCEHRIEPITRGFQVMAVFNLVTKSKSIENILTDLIHANMGTTTLPPAQPIVRCLNDLLDFWIENNKQLPSKLVIPLQHPWDYSPYFTLLYRERTRQILDLIRQVLNARSTFLLYSAILQQDQYPTENIDNRLVLHKFVLLNSTQSDLALKFDEQQERTMNSTEFLGDLHVYLDALDAISPAQQDCKVIRSNNEYQVLVLLPKINQWDILLDDHSSAYHHLSFIISMPRFSHHLNDFFRCFLRDQTSLIARLTPFVQSLSRLQYSTDSVDIIKEFLQIKQIRENFFNESALVDEIVLLIDRFDHCSILAKGFFHFFRQLLNHWMPAKLKEFCRMLLNIKRLATRALLINALIRFIFKPRSKSRHISLGTLCEILHLLIVDGSYSIDVQLIIAQQIVKRVRKFPNDNDILRNGLKAHLIPMLINIYRNQLKSNSETCSLSIAFTFVYQYCLNALNYFCSSSYLFNSPSTYDPISANEAALLCHCEVCDPFREFLLDEHSSTWVVDLTKKRANNDCLFNTIKQYPSLSTEYKYDPITGQKQTLIISKTAYEQEQKQLCFHLRRLLMQLEKI